MLRPVVSIIIPAYNASRFIAETINSVLDQTVKNIELIIVDDGSADGQNEIIEKIISDDKRARLVSQRNSGVSVARNKGIELSHGQYLAFLDADDVWLPDNLAMKIEKFALHDYGLVHSNGEVIDENGILSGTILEGREGFLLDDLLLWDRTQIPGPSSILVKRSVIEETGLFDTRLSTSADLDFFIRVSLKYKIGKIDNISWHYRIHNSNMHKNISAMEHDVLLIYDKASRMGLFKDEQFRKKCFSNMYMILAKSWAGDGHNYLRGIKFLMRSVTTRPAQVIKLIRESFNRFTTVLSR